MRVFKIVEENGRFHILEKGLLWGWNQTYKYRYGWYYALYLPQNGYVELSFDSEEEALNELQELLANEEQIV